MFRTVVLDGRGGAILWGDGEAAALTTWTIVRDAQHKFTLSARITTHDRYRLAQLPLMFAAPRRQKPTGLWCFPVLPKTLSLNGTTLTAALGPPEGR